MAAAKSKKSKTPSKKDKATPPTPTTAATSTKTSTPATGSGIPIPDPPPKDENYDQDLVATPAGKKSKKKEVGAGLAGHFLVKQLLGTAPKNNPNPVELKLEELDEKMLRMRLDALDRDLAQYKEKCARYKSENEWYRNEIESTEKDTTEYIRYLIAKKEEKQATIDSLQDGKKKDTEVFAQKRRDREAYNKTKIAELKNVIIELELKLEAKQQEMMGLSDIISKRSRHEAEIIKVKQDITDTDRAHNEKVAILERSLLETRIKLQREADLKIQEMENAAQEKATNYLKEHAIAMENENVKLEAELRNCIVTTQELLKKKELIEAENQALEREQKVRQDLLKLRIERVMEAQSREKKKDMVRSHRVMSAKKDIFKNISTRYPNLKRDGLLPLDDGEEAQRLSRLRTAESLRQATNGKYKAKISGGGQERPVLKLVVMAGSDKTDTTAAESKGVLDEATKTANMIAELSHKWEISDDSDEEFF
ncbi:UNVERIFIED_CONTAM: hypothetical protein HDU68_007154 [Siphonaria sp. JEL0065]|nr:hypothetical protein HDU68_007154 [Siphonaria sp. JEL0065]